MDYVEKLFVLGPTTQLTEGVVSEADAARWRRYLENEGQPLLRSPTEVRSLMNCKVETPRVPEGPQPEYLLEHLDPATEGTSLFPGELTWQLYFRDVHGIYAESTEELLSALETAGWPESKMARFRNLDLNEVIPLDSPEDKEYVEKTLEFAAQDDVYVSCLECAFGMVRAITAAFPESSEPDRIVAKLRLFPEEKGVRWAYAVGMISMTALQELLNALDSGVRVRFARPSDPPFWEPIDLTII